jgi:REP element-mobilizing transposase RayT
MSRKYKITDQEYPYFVTFTIINWIDVFIRDEYRNIILESIKYCQEKKGLVVHAWCIMTSHIHLILSSKELRESDETKKLEDIIRDLKSYTSRKIRLLLENKDGFGESRREWMYWMMQRAGSKNPNNIDFQFWMQHNQPIEIRTESFMLQKLEYIHNNPVVAGFVELQEHWKYSSAKDYYGTGKGLLDIVLLT